MRDLFKDDANIYNYFKVGRKFWTGLARLDSDKWELITITHKRSGVVFYTSSDRQGEQYFTENSVFSHLLIPETIYLSELPYDITDDDDICFDDYNGSITIKIVKCL